MATYKVEQFHITAGERTFHFVSYEGVAANERRGEQEVGPMWYLMGPGKRWPVMPHQIGQPADEVEFGLRTWMEQQGFGRGT